MSVTRRSTLLFAAASLCELSRSASANEKEYPNRHIRFIVPYGVGGGADTTARLIGKAMGEVLDTPLVIINQPGANANIGTASMVRATPDGYTIILLTANQTISKTLYRSLSYDLLTDLVPVSLVAKTPSILAVNPSTPARTLKDLIALAAAAPGKLNYAGDQAGPQFLGMELLKSMANIDITNIPYVGTGEGIVAALSGQASVIMAPGGILVPYIRGGQLRGLAVSSKERLALFPDLPSIAESGLPEYDVNQWYGIAVPAGTPDAIVEKLNAACAKALAAPELKKKFADLASITVGSSSQEFAKFLSDDVNLWATAIKASNIPMR
jgi:tripartite-type tricarboxylate transporter receptor subunit TctC